MGSKIRLNEDPEGFPDSEAAAGESAGSAVAGSASAAGDRRPGRRFRRGSNKKAKTDRADSIPTTEKITQSQQQPETSESDAAKTQLESETSETDAAHPQRPKTSESDAVKTQLKSEISETDAAHPQQPKTSGSDAARSKSYTNIAGIAGIEIDQPRPSRPLSEAELFRADQQKRTGMERRARKLIRIAAATAVVFVALIIFPLPITGALNWLPRNLMTPDQYYRVLQEHLHELALLLSGENYRAMTDLSVTQLGAIHDMKDSILEQIGALAVGAGLACVGASFQGSFRNSIASPTTLGVMSGGTLMSTVYVMWGSAWFGESFNAKLERATGISWAGHMAFVFIGCLGAVLFTIFIARKASRGRSLTVMLIVVGMVFSGACSSVSSLITYTVNMTDPYGSKAATLQQAMAGQINPSATWQLVIALGILLAVLQIMAKRMNLLMFGEDEARAMGIRVERMRRVMLLITTLIMAVIISTCGGISFLGLIIPHIARRAVGSDFRYLLPGCMIIGGLFLMICNVIPVMDWMGTNHVGNYTSIIGGIVFLFMILTNRRKHNADWA